MANKKTSEAALLEQWHVAIENSQKQPEIATQIAKYGYNTAKIEEGKTLLLKTQTIWQQKKQEAQENTEASKAFKAKKEDLFKLYSNHRKKAKALFKQQPEIQVKLQIKGVLPGAYVTKMQAIQHFYTQLEQNSDIATTLQSYNITEQELEQAQTLVIETQQARVHYLKEEGESQDATKQKDQALTEMKNWMQDFYAMARIALENNPQLLEAIGLFIKS